MDWMDLTAGELVAKFRRHFPGVVSMALASASGPLFRNMLAARFAGEDGSSDFSALLDGDGQTVKDISTGREIPVDTFGLLRRALRGEDGGMASEDFLLDMYMLFRSIAGNCNLPPSHARAEGYARRWQCASDAKTAAAMQSNRKRIIESLIERIDLRRPGEHRKFFFPAGATHSEKLALADEWWSDFRFHLSMAARSPREVNRLLGGTLDEDTLERMSRARRKGMPFFLTPYYASLMDITGKGYDDKAIRSYVIYSDELVETYGSIRAWEKEDQIEEGRPNAAGWILPPGGNVHRRYPEVAILIPDSMGRACGGLCAPCQRMYGFQQRRLNFEFDALKPNEQWASKLRRLMLYFERDAELRDILITGGDALMSQNKTLRNILDAVLRTAVRKRRAGAGSIDRVRLGTRIPAYLPMRVDDELAEILAGFRRRGIEAGISQFVIQTHFQSPLELTPEALRAIRMLQSAGWLVTNQMVFTVAASRRGHAARLRRELNKAGVVCYYTFSVKGFAENYSLFTPNCRSLQEMAEEKRLGALDGGMQAEIAALAANPETMGRSLPAFLRRNNLPFAATDRSVMNLPGIGKSMTLSTIGITPEGRRILRFGHDPGRRHSHAVDDMGDVFITEAKPVADYLRQLRDMGEDPADYASVWDYRSGETERRMALFEYDQ